MINREDMLQLEHVQVIGPKSWNFNLDGRSYNLSSLARSCICMKRSPKCGDSSVSSGVSRSGICCFTLFLKK